MKTYPLAPAKLLSENGSMFLRVTKRRKDGKENRYFSIVENHRTVSGKVVQRHVLYLGEINDSQQAAWAKTIEVFDGRDKQPRQMVLFAGDAKITQQYPYEAVHIQINQLQLRRPRQWGACWLACQLWQLLKLDDFWQARLAPSRKGTDWAQVLKILVVYRLICPGSEWRLHRHWYGQSALADLLGADTVVADDTLYRCLDKITTYKDDLFSYLRQRWQDLFSAGFDVLLYDLTSTYFECDVPALGKRKFGHSRDKRSDCVQVVIALVVTPQGLPVAYEVMDGNTSDKTTLGKFIEKIQAKYGKSRRVWLMDRGVPTEEQLRKMREADYPICYLVGTPRAQLNKLEQQLAKQDWEQAREGVQVKMVEQDKEIYVLAKSSARGAKERSMRKRKLKTYWARLKQLQAQKVQRDKLLMKLGAAQKQAGSIARAVEIDVEPPTSADRAVFKFSLNRDKLRAVIQREGRYLLRSYQCGQDAAQLWNYYMQLTEVEQAFKDLKQDLAIRPIFHQQDKRIEAHIFVCFLAYCLFATLKQKTKALAPGLTSRSVLEKFQTIEMVDVHVPTTDGREIVLSRYTQPDKDCQMLLQRLQLHLPSQPPPKIMSAS